MNYENFKYSLLKSLEKSIGAGVIVQLKIHNDNDVYSFTDLSTMKVFGLSCEEAYAIYKDSYSHLSDAEALKIITDTMTKEYRDMLARNTNPQMYRTADKSKIIYRLEPVPNVGIPYVPYNGLVIVFYELLEEQKDCIKTLTITQAFLDTNNLTLEDVLKLANKNTPILLPYTFKTLEAHTFDGTKNSLAGSDAAELLGSLLLQKMGIIPESGFYVLSNRQVTCGSTCILYPEALRTVSRELQDDLVILMNSIHEALVIPSGMHDIRRLSKFLRSAQEAFLKECDARDILSTEIYMYSRKDHSLKVMK